jgi:DNA polymerase-3 subunit gamma/tau
MSYQVLARKYRPNSFDEVIGQDHVVQVIKNSIEQERVHQAFLFSGTRGVGKTTIARLLAKCLNCMSSEAIQEGKSIDFLEIDAASRTGVEHMRELLSSVHTSPSVSRFKIFLIDEVHMLSKGSFNALLKTLEEPPSHVIFLMATTDPEKVPKTVISRCLQLNLKTVSRNNLQEHFRKICEKEGINSDDESLSLVGYGL